MQVDFIQHGDSIALIKNLEDCSIHLILSDIPYGINYEEWDVLHNNKNSALLGASPAQKEAGDVFKSRGKPLNGWSKADKDISLEYYEWCKKWATEWIRVLKPGASCFVFAGRRMSHRCICALEDSGFIFKDMLAWQKTSAAYRAQRISCVFERRNDLENAKKWTGWKIGNLKPLFEPILWFMKPYPIGETLTDNVLLHGVGAYNEKVLKEAILQNAGNEICSNIFKNKKDLKTDTGLHPTQKPLSLMETLIEFTTLENQVVLDPFLGSGTTAIAAIKTKRHFIGFEMDEKYFNIANTRIAKALEKTQDVARSL